MKGFSATSLHLSNAGHRGKESSWGLLKWERKSNIESAKARIAAASGELGTSIGSRQSENKIQTHGRKNSF